MTDVTNLELAQLIAESIAKKPGDWKRKPNPHLTINCEGLGLGVMEIGGTMPAHARIYKVAAVNEEGGGETVIDIGPGDSEAHAVMVKALASFRTEAEREARQRIGDKLKVLLEGDAKARAAVKKKLAN